jgi:hypothetical protein
VYAKFKKSTGKMVTLLAWIIPKKNVTTIPNKRK